MDCLEPLRFRTLANAPCAVAAAIASDHFPKDFLAKFRAIDFGVWRPESSGNYRSWSVHRVLGFTGSGPMIISWSSDG